MFTFWTFSLKNLQSEALGVEANVLHWGLFPCILKLEASARPTLCQGGKMSSITHSYVSYASSFSPWKDIILTIHAFGNEKYVIFFKNIVSFVILKLSLWCNYS